MDYILYLLRSLWRVRWWIIIGTLLVTAFVFFKTRNMRGYYGVEAILYTGVVSGYGIAENDVAANWALAQNAVENLINIIQSESTYKRVSLRLFSRILIKGNPKEDQDGITASSYNYVYNHIKNSPDGKRLISLIDKNSEDKTMENFIKYERPDQTNYIYGLFYFQHPYFSYQALKKIQVAKIGNSDLLEIKYSSPDPGIAYNTISILMDEFVNQYRELRYGETDKVIAYFKSELERIGTELTRHEDDLTQYNVDNKIINYYDETKEVAAINKEFELREQDVLFAYNSSKAMLAELERQMDINAKQTIKNIELVDKLKEASTLTGKITEMETLSSSDKGNTNNSNLQQYKEQLGQTRKELSNLSNSYINGKYTKEGIAKTNIIEQWLDQTLLFEKAKAELDIVRESRIDLNQKYQFFAPVGTTIKRKERVINFAEQSYLTNLKSYNDALLRKKNLEMTSSTFKVLNPPAYPIGAQVTDRRKIVMMAGLGSLIFFIIIFLIIEFIDRTLRDTTRVIKLTGCPVLGSYPTIENKPYAKNYKDIGTRYMSSSILRFFNEKERKGPYILNILSMQDGSGKSFLGEQLEIYWKTLGLNVKRIISGADFDGNSSKYTLANCIKDFYNIGNEDILIIEHPELDKSNIPTGVLQDSDLNLLILSAHNGWKAMDKELLSKLKNQLGTNPYIYINYAPVYDVENYAGMLPPNGFFRQQSYYLRQLCLTEDYFFWKKHLRLRRANKQYIDDEDE